MGLNKKEIGWRIRETRESRGMDRVRFADKSGMKYTSLRKIEDGSYLPGVESLCMIANGLDVCYEYVLHGTEYQITANAYQRLAARTMDRSWNDSEVEYHALFGMASEVGELHGIYQKEYQGHIDTDDHKKKEIGDLLWFIAEYCTVQGWSLGEVMQMNIDKLKARYPEGFAAERSLHRKAGDI